MELQIITMNTHTQWYYRDEFQIFYKGDSQEAEDAISIAYMAPSITPFPNLNPGFRFVYNIFY